MSDYNTNAAPDARDFLGNYLKQEDVPEQIEVRIVDVYGEEIPGEPRDKLVAKFAEFQNPMILNATNIKRLCKIFRTTSTAQWRGAVTLYVDPDVEFGGKTVGGLRLRPARPNGAATTREQPRRAQQPEPTYDEDFF